MLDLHIYALFWFLYSLLFKLWFKETLATLKFRWKIFSQNSNVSSVKKSCSLDKQVFKDILKSLYNSILHSKLWIHCVSLKHHIVLYLTKVFSNFPKQFCSFKIIFLILCLFGDFYHYFLKTYTNCASRHHFL